MRLWTQHSGPMPSNLCFLNDNTARVSDNATVTRFIQRNTLVYYRLVKGELFVESPAGQPMPIH